MLIGMHTLLDRWSNQWKKKEGRRSGRRLFCLRCSAGTIFRLHVCGTDADCVNYGRLALPCRRVRCRNSNRLATIY